MKRIFYLTGLALFASCTQNENRTASASTTTDTTTTAYSTNGKQVVVYTTADSGNYRLTATDTLQFSDFGQPLETQACVFVDPTRTFQTLVGIGGALTDAAAETFAK